MESCHVVLRKLKVYFPKHVLFIINAYAELSRSRTLLDFPKYVRKFKYKTKRDAHAFLWIRKTFTHNIKEWGRKLQLRPFSVYVLLNFTNPGREKELISSNVHLFLVFIYIKNIRCRTAKSAYFRVAALLRAT